MTLDEFNQFCSALPATNKVIQWGDAHVWKVDSKIFAIASGPIDAGDHWRISFKASDMSFEILSNQTGLAPAPYLARAKWIQVQEAQALSNEEMAAYLQQAHTLIAAKLTKARQRQLGLLET